MMSRNSDPAKNTNIANATIRNVARTPSPTPSEFETLNNTSHFSIQRVFSNWKYAIPLAILLIIVTLFFVFNKQIVHALEPVGNDLRKCVFDCTLACIGLLGINVIVFIYVLARLKAGWLIPIAILFVLSFPPLFGHEIVHMLVGLVYGLGAAFGIVAVGTLLGELGNFYAFKYFLTSHAEKLEKKKVQYACLARVVRSGGFWIALVVRYSAIPGHFTTAIFSVTGMNVLTFTAAAILSLPKQFVTVYIGHVLKEDGDSSSSSSSKDRKISLLVLFVTILVTYAAMWYLKKQINAVKHEVIYERRKARQFYLQNISPSDAENQAIIQAPSPRYIAGPTGAGSLPQAVDNNIHVGRSTRRVEQGEEIYRLANMPRHPEGGNSSYYGTLGYPPPSYPPDGSRN